MKKLGSLALTLTGVALIIGVILFPDFRKKVGPETKVLKLPDFKGRYIPAGSFSKPQGAVIGAGFDPISKWNESALIIPDIRTNGHGFNTFAVLQVWMPDPQTPNAWLTAEKIVFATDEWNGWMSYQVGSVYFEADTLRIVPDKTLDFVHGFFMFFTFIAGLAAIITGVVYFKNLRVKRIPCVIEG